jgi:molybdate transport system substrate-binding protein
MFKYKFINKIAYSVSISLSLSISAFAEEIQIFSASSTREAINEIILKFQNSHQNDKVIVTYGASGKGYTQFHNGLSYDIFLSADQTYPDKIFADGDALDKPKIYAKGLMALYSKNGKYLNIEELKTDEVKKIAVANVKTAPYGALAIKLLIKYNLYKLVENKLVFGENISQPIQFVDSGNADVGFVALSLIKNSKDSLTYKEIDRNQYEPLAQSFVITKYAKNKTLAKEFTEYLLNNDSQEIFKKYGFE